MNKLLLGDNLEIMKTMESESVDLIYLDPPFFSNRNYEVIWGDTGEIRSFQDRWAGGISHYIDWLKERVAEMHRILKNTGSIYLHCDWHADAYIRVDILDKVFGENNFVAEIIWHYSWGVRTPKRWNRKHDNIYHYSKTDNITFNANEVLEERTLSEASKKRLEYKGALIKDFNKRGQSEMALPSDVWYIATINGMSSERIGYPTQKPEALLERIIKASSNKNDVILDPFVGGGTTVAVADRLDRQWIGIDQSVAAIKVSEMRLEKQWSLFSFEKQSAVQPYMVQLHKYDYDTLRYKDAFEFESWIVQQFGGASNTKQRGDFGLDGKAKDGAPIQVKRSDNIGRNVIDNFKSAVERFDKRLYDKNVKNKKPVGYIIAFSFGKGAIEEVSRLKIKENIIIELVKVENIVSIGKKPKLSLDVLSSQKTENGLLEIEFCAKCESLSEIKFYSYSWDFNFNEKEKFHANVIIDKKGVQKHVFKAGTYSVAVKVFDNDGLENIEIIKLKVNGAVEKVDE